MIKRLNILISLHLQWDWDRNREILPEICISVQNAIFLWFSYQKTNSAWTRWKRRSRCFRIFMTHRGEKLFFHWYRLSKLGNIYFKSFQIWAYFVNFSSTSQKIYCKTYIQSQYLRFIIMLSTFEYRRSRGTILMNNWALEPT